MIVKHNFELFKQHINIIEVIRHYIPIKKDGKSYSACCPFHQEDTPSFKVDINKGIFKCFGCQKAGDAIEFVKEYTKLDFIDSCKQIAGIIGFNLEFENGKSDNSATLYEANLTFLEYCHSRKHEVLDFINNRGLDSQILDVFKLGYSGEVFEMKKNTDVENLKTLGLFYDSANGLQSSFKKRLIIPIFDSRARIVGFGARTLGQDKPKYINSKESKIYKKRFILYGFSVAKEHIAKANEVYIVEGYFDVMSLYQAGIKNSVGLCGTALSKEHLALFSRYDNLAINLLLDNDKAGIEATKKSIILLLQNAFYNSFVVVIDSKCKDCNEILMSERDKFQTMQKMPIIEWYIRQIHKRFCDTSLSIEKKHIIINEVKAFLDTLQAEFIRLEYYKFAKNLFGFEIDTKREAKKKPKSYKGFAIYNHDIIALRLLKSAFNNRVYQECLRQFGHRIYFKNLENEFDSVINNTIHENIASLVFFDIPEYENYQSFSLDLFNYIERAKKFIKQDILRSTLSLENKLKELQRFNIV